MTAAWREEPTMPRYEVSLRDENGRELESPTGARTMREVHERLDRTDGAVSAVVRVAATGKTEIVRGFGGGVG